ncbi:MAG: hypothetical protein ACRDQ5_00570 [Sciscionella sp.]
MPVVLPPEAKEDGYMDDSLLISEEVVSTVRDRATESLADNDGND